jgi:hypothetical protein
MEEIRQLQENESNPFSDEQREGLIAPAMRRFRTPEQKAHYERELLEAVRFVDRVFQGRKSDMELFQEAMSTSDFPILFGDILDRQTLARYREWTVSFADLVQERRARSMTRSSKLYPQQLGLDSKLDPVEQLTEYPAGSVTEQSPIVIPPPVKYGRRFGLSWEVLQDDGPDSLLDVPGQFATAARRTEEDAVYQTFLGTSGYNTTLFNNTNKNIINVTNGAATNNPALSMASLSDALLVLSRMVDESGYPIQFDFVNLVVPPALEVIANNIINTVQVELTTDGGDANRRLIANNWLARRLRIIVNPYIPRYATVANGNTTWFLWARPDGAPGGRAAIWIQRLRGNEDPAIFVREPNARRLGGGGGNPLDGSFENDSIEWKVRHILNAGILDPKYAVVSNGSGT